MQKSHNIDLIFSAAPDLNVRHFKAVISLATFKSFLAAASFLEISQPGLTRIIQQAEKRLGFELFRRGSKMVTLTPAGAEFLVFAERFLQEFSNQTQRIRLNHFEERLKISISCLMSISHVVLPGVINDFKKKNPNISIEIHEGVGRLISDAVIEGRVDFGIGSSDFYPKGVSIVEEVEERFVVVMPKGHELAILPELTLDQIGHWPLISMPATSGIRQLLDAEALKAGVVLQHEITTSQYDTMFKLLLKGIGLSVVPISVERGMDISKLTVRPLTPLINRKIAVLIKSGQSLHGTQMQFVDLLLPWLKKVLR